MAVYAEISVIPITGSSSMGEQVRVAFDAISRTEGIKATLTPLGTQIEAKDTDAVLNAIKAAHGAARTISSIRIDQRRDKDQTLEDKVRSVNSRLGR